MILPKYSSGDVLIRRVDNGWMAISMCEHSQGGLAVYVYEDPKEPAWSEKSLAALLADQFRHYMQKESRAGIKVEVSELTKQEEAVSKELRH